jgi:carbonic anhydrase/acetyltransferase-like protein (isoleucine patch superfamily)
MVRPATSSDLSSITKMLAANQSLADGYRQLYQGQPATGASLGIAPTVTGIFNGNLATVEGVGAVPGSATTTTPYLPPGASPKFVSPNQGLVSVTLTRFLARITGAVVFNERAGEIEHAPGRSNSIRADMGGPINIGSIGHMGNEVTINALSGGELSIGQNFVAGSNATILGCSSSTTKIAMGDNVTIGNGAVVQGTSLGRGSTVGDRAYLLNSTFPAGTHIPAGAIYESNKLIGYVQW